MQSLRMVSSGAAWEPRAGIRCLHCAETPPTPFPIVSEFNVDTKRFLAYNGVACGPACALAYVVDSEDMCANPAMRAVNVLFQSRCGYDNVVPAPPRAAMAAFGGPLPRGGPDRVNIAIVRPPVEGAPASVLVNAQRVSDLSDSSDEDVGGEEDDMSEDEVPPPPKGAAAKKPHPPRRAAAPAVVLPAAPRAPAPPAAPPLMAHLLRKRGAK
jgi:hypothetical protein